VQQTDFITLNPMARSHFPVGHAELKFAQHHSTESDASARLASSATGARYFDAGRSADHHNEIQLPPPLVRIRLGFGEFKGKQRPPADIGGVVNGLEAG
jgi:hypothetical protein